MSRLGGIIIIYNNMYTLLQVEYVGAGREYSRQTADNGV